MKKFKRINTDSSSSSSVIPVKSYSNADSMKLQILKDNRGKSGIYRWTNKINGKTYVGRSIDLYTRFRNYFSINHLMHPSKYLNSVFISKF